MTDPYVFDEWAVSCEDPSCNWCHATDQGRSGRVTVPPGVLADVDLHAVASTGPVEPFTVAEWLVRYGIADPNPMPRFRRWWRK